MPSDLPQPASYNRFDPLDEQDDVSRLPAVREPAANDNVVAANAAVPNAAAASSGVVANIAAAEAESIFNSEKLTASEAEERRAGQLLDRAFSSWERGDTAGAILACRQSLTLSPASAPAYSMLGLLLERSDDTNGAIAAYEKAVEIEPSSLLERDSARRLRASMGQALPTRFHFQEAELFDAIDGEPADDLATNRSDDTAPNTPEFPALGSNTPLESSARAPIAAAPIAAASVATSSTRLNAETSSAVATSSASTVVASPSTSPASTTSLPPTPTVTTKVAAVSPSISTSGVATATTAASQAAASQAAAVRVPAAATQVTPTQTAPPQNEAPVRARPMRATLPAAAPQAAAPQAAVSTTNSAGASALENTARPATIAASIEPTPSAIATSVAAPSSLVAPIATPLVVHTGDAPSTSSGALSRLDTMLGSRSTFWTRSLPLMAAAGTGFLFLLWSRDIALERERRAVSTTSTTIINNTSAPGATRNSPSDATNGMENGTVVTNGIVTNSATASNATASNAAAPNAAATNAAAPNAATSNAVAAAAGGTTAESSTRSAAQTPSVEPQIAPSGLVVSNAPSAVRRASSSAARAASQRESVMRPSNRRAETVRTRRTFRAENQERPARRSRYADADLAANGSSSGGSRVLRQPDVRLIPPAGVPQLPRAQESSSGAANNGTGNALPPVAPGGSVEEGAGSGGLRPYAGPLPSFPSPSQVQSRAQNEIRPRPSSSASSSSTSGSARDSESAYQYQTRALTYVEQGDNARAASDFQSAMALYRRQIAHGENLAEARRGLEACQKGLRLISAS